MEFDLLGLLDGNVRSASSAQASLRERINSVIPAVVSDTKDTEKLGRVKVRFAFTGRVESRWARVAVPFAGSLRGTYFVPEVDDEVLVAFRNGDLDQPYVIGFLWSAKARPPEAEASQRRSVIRTKSGHRLVLDEGDKRESVTLRTAKGHRVVLSDYKDAADIEIRSTDGKVSISIDSDTGAIKLRSTTNGSISIEAPGGQVTIEATNVSIKAAGTLNLEGQNVAITGHQSVRIN